VVTIAVRELGPVIKLLASPALIDGGTEVVLHIAEHTLPSQKLTRVFTIHWQNGGPGVIKGVESLSDDIRFALVHALQSPTLQKLCSQNIEQTYCPAMPVIAGRANR
jgi:hypothetical protein